ncbi:hypothetical protein LSTR_LSTR016246, partial [Laodelphax striatellus]
LPEPEVCTKRSRPPALTSKQLLRSRLMKLMQSLGLWDERLATEIPGSWEKYDNFIVFNDKYFTDVVWSKAGAQLWKIVADVFGVENVALKGRIAADSFRSPSVEIVFGDSDLVRFKDNGILYTWNATSCMFSRGNVTERHRIGKLDCRGEVVVDLFAGIGYFTLPFLLKAKCEHLHACEWNPRSVQALKHNLELNKVVDKCTIHEGDNRVVCPRNLADRVNFGLIPTSRDSWKTGCLALKSARGGVLHVHENLNTKLTNSNCGCKDVTHVCEVLKCQICVKLLDKLCINRGTNFPINSLSFKLISQSKSGENISLKQIYGGDSTGKPISKGGKINNVTLHEISESNSSDERVNLLLDKDTDSGLSWKKYEWLIWALHTSHCFGRIFNEIYKKPWIVSVKNLHHVKSYAPHVEHMVLDLDCRPSN